MKQFLRRFFPIILGILAFGSVAYATTLIVSQGGTGVATITGFIKGNGTSPFSTATPGTDFLIPCSALTTGSMLFANSSGQVCQDNADLFYDPTNHALGLGTTSPFSDLGRFKVLGSKTASVTSGASLVNIKDASTYNTTSANKVNYGAIISNVSTESGGGNILTNVALLTTASGGDNNYGLLVSAGLVGLGNQAPTEQLDVTGNIKASSLASAGTKCVQASATGVLSITSGTCATSSTPGGSNTQVQFNDSGAFGGDAKFTFNKSTGATLINGQITTANGTAAAPAFSFTGDADTGLFHSSTNQVGISAGGTEFLQVRSDGKVGIGNNVGLTAYPLDVRSTMNGPSSIHMTNTSTGSLAESSFALMNDFGTGDTVAELFLNGGNNTNYGGANSLNLYTYISGAALTFGTGAANPANERMRISGTGVVSINDLAGSGTRCLQASSTGVLSATSTGCAAAFTLTDGSGTTASGTAVNLGGNLTQNAIIDGGSAYDFDFESGNTGFLTDFNVGVTKIGDVHSNVNGTQLTISDGLGDGAAYFSNSNMDAFVGINTSTPSVALDVVGDIALAKNATYSTGGLLETNLGQKTIFIGDGEDQNNGNNIFVDDTNGLAFYKDVNNTGKFGINNPSPSVALDVFGDVHVATNDYNTGLFDITDTTGTVSIGDYMGHVGNTFIKVDDPDEKITLKAQTTLQFGTFGLGNHTGTPTFALSVDAAGTVIETTNSYATVAASNDLTGQTAAVSSITAFTPSSNGVYRIGGYLNVTAISAGTITLKVTYTDENNVFVTRILPLAVASTGAVGTTATAVGDYSATDLQIRIANGNPITILTTFTGVSTTYDVGGTIEQLR